MCSPKDAVWMPHNAVSLGVLPVFCWSQPKNLNAVFRKRRRNGNRFITPVSKIVSGLEPGILGLGAR